MSDAVRTVAVWCPDWPVVAAAAGGLEPERPVAVLAANRVVACSAAARADGVRRGLRRREAQARCPGLLVLADDPDRDARAFEPVVCAIEALVPGVEVIRPGLLILAARGPARYYGGESKVAERIVDAVAAETGVECQIGIADGIFTATLAAHRGVVVEPGASREFLAPLPVTELCQPADPSARGRVELVGLLRRLGLRTLGSFAALPVRDVASRFGAAAVYAHRLASGVQERPVGKREPPVDLTVVQRFDPPIERVDAVAFAARQPAARLHDLLAARGLASTRLRVYAQTDHGEELSRVWRCAEPLTPTGIADRVRWQLDAWLTGRSARWEASGSEPAGGIVLLRLAPEEVVPVGALQHGLWGETGQADERAGRALVRVQGLLGPDAVFTAVLGGGRDPAQRVTLVPWGDELVPAHPARPPWPGRLPAPFPGTVPADPQPVELLDEDGHGVGVTGRGVLTGEPRRVVSGEGQPREVLAWAGPWPVEERWWDPDGGRRRARLQVVLDAAEAGHTALLLACEGGRWRVEGVYD
jgi:protein ImuB